MNNIPALLTTVSGVRITDVEGWETFRRDEIKTLFENYVYGVRDIERPAGLTFALAGECEEYGMRVKSLTAGFGDFSFPFKLYLPKEKKGPLPVFVYVIHEYMEDDLRYDDHGNMFRTASPSVFPVKDITDRGFAVAAVPTRSLYRDWHAHAEYNHGVLAAARSPKGRNEHSWASISAWAWGVSRVIDYLETDPEIDSTKIASIGHSRSGKAALWAGALDGRILLTVANNTGCMGAAILRGKKGERAKEINVSDWFCPKFKDYNEREHLLPVDQHMLLAMVAPRFLYVADSIEDEWSDPDAEFLSARLASEVYALYGHNGLIAPEKPILNEVYQEGRIAFHVKEGDHSQTKFDWDKEMDYFEKIIDGLVK
ncbi:MAG: hypothetical protein IJ012_03340 [Clostridia bacterium]|nr:hypothetical protein [Clostridia bacterium]